MPLVELEAVHKAFWIPSESRDTVREHLFSAFRPRRFRQLHVLEDIDLHLNRVETLGIMGRNGSGKTTLLRLICGIYVPDRGTVSVRGALTPVLELGVGWNPDLDAIDNVFVAGSVIGLSLAEIRASLDDILAFAELQPFARLKLKHYSTGMAARLAYAVAFHAVQDVLVLDEIFAVGDAGFKARCEERFRLLRARGHSVIIVTHDPRIIRAFCDRAVLLDGGRIAAEGAPDDVADQYLACMAGSALKHTAFDAAV